MWCVSVLNAGITFLDGSGVGTKYFCQPQERSDVVFGPFSFQDLELLDFSYTHREDQGNLGVIEALGDMLPPLNRTQFSGYTGCGLVHLFFRHSGYHGAFNLALLMSPCDCIDTSERSSSVSRLLDLYSLLGSFDIIVVGGQRVVPFCDSGDDELLVSRPLPL